jgi:hypothetical protein
MFKLIIIFMIINVVNSQIIALNNGRSWLYPCAVNKCLESIERCIEKKCIGEGQCIHCLNKVVLTTVTEIPTTTTVQINENPQCKFIVFFFFLTKLKLLMIKDIIYFKQ